jgi:hypothetical protein
MSLELFVSKRKAIKIKKKIKAKKRRISNRDNNISNRNKSKITYPNILNKTESKLSDITNNISNINESKISCSTDLLNISDTTNNISNSKLNNSYTKNAYMNYNGHQDKTDVLFGCFLKNMYTDIDDVELDDIIGDQRDAIIDTLKKRRGSILEDEQYNNTDSILLINRLLQLIGD